MVLKEELEKIQKELESEGSKEGIATIEKAIEKLQDSGIAEKALGVGDQAPDFTLQSTRGEISLSSQLKQGPVILTFYRGQW